MPKRIRSNRRSTHTRVLPVFLTIGVCVAMVAGLVSPSGRVGATSAEVAMAAAIDSLDESDRYWALNQQRTYGSCAARQQGESTTRAEGCNEQYFELAALMMAQSCLATSGCAEKFSYRLMSSAGDGGDVVVTLARLIKDLIKGAFLSCIEGVPEDEEYKYSDDVETFVHIFGCGLAAFLGFPVARVLIKGLKHLNRPRPGPRIGDLAPYVSDDLREGLRQTQGVRDGLALELFVANPGLYATL